MLHAVDWTRLTCAAHASDLRRPRIWPAPTTRPVRTAPLMRRPGPSRLAAHV